jgi:pSer/pThr/pTyr-binding forkhead associated (FHA) protein
VSALHRSTPAELKARLEAERRGTPFLLFFDGAGRQVLLELAGEITVGRGADCDVALGWDREVSRLHAQLERVGGQWVLVDDGLSRNGSFVNGERVVGRRVLRDGDRLVFGETPVVYRAPATTGGSSTIGVTTSPAAVNLTPTQKQILVALCRPVRESAFATPLTNKEIAEEVSLSVDAVKAHLRTLFERFGLEDLPQNQKRARLAAIALLQGIVTQRD